MDKADGIARVEITSTQNLWDWLAEHHGQNESVWLVTWKKAEGAPYVGREAVLDALVAWGWSDGTRRKLDSARTQQLISPRQQQVWAETYQRRAARLEEEGLMKPPGLAKIAEAKAAGLWQAWADVDALEVPTDLAVALSSAEAKAWFAGAAPSYRRNVLRFLRSAKRPETRAERIALIADHAARGEKLPQY